MGTRADFYIGRGKSAEWLGSIAWDGYPEGIICDPSARSTGLDSSTTADAFRAAVKRFLAKRDDATFPEHGWPWPWDDSNTSDYAYAFDDGALYITAPDGWITVAESDRRDELEKRANGSDAEQASAAQAELDGFDVPSKRLDFPDMSERKNVNFGKRSGVIILGR